MQQGPVAGRGIAALILQGRFVTVDLSALGYERAHRRAVRCWS
jgi:hypothetical protein